MVDKLLVDHQGTAAELKTLEYQVQCLEDECNAATVIVVELEQKFEAEYA